MLGSLKTPGEFAAPPAAGEVAPVQRVDRARYAGEKGEAVSLSEAVAVGGAQMLVPVDFSDLSLRVLNFAGELAKEFGGAIGLLHVVVPPGLIRRALGRKADLGNMQREGLVRVQEWEAVAVSRCRRAGAKVVVGRPASGIVAAADRLGVDLVVLASRGGNWLRNFLHRSTAVDVARASTRPVLIVPERLLIEGADGALLKAGALWNNLLVPVDTGEGDRTALRYAAGWAGAMKSRLTIFRVLSTGAAGDRGNPFRSRHRAEEGELQAVARRVAGAGIEVQVLSGQGVADADVILRAATTAGSELVVLTLNRTGQRIANRLVRASRCAVLAVPGGGENRSGCRARDFMTRI